MILRKKFLYMRAFGAHKKNRIHIKRKLIEKKNLPANQLTFVMR